MEDLSPTHTAEIERVIANYTPRNLNLRQWFTVEVFVRDTIRLANPCNGEDARRLLTMLSRLACWAHCICGHPLTVAAVLHPAVVTEYAEHELRLTPKVVAMWQQRMISLGKRLAPDLFPSQPSTAPTTPWRPDPYTADEVTRVHNWALAQRTISRRDNAHILLALTLGAGLRSNELARIKNRHVHIDDDGVVIELSQRRIPVLARYEAVLIGAVEGMPAGMHLLCPTRETRTARMVQGFLRDCNEDSGLRPVVQRLRSTWLVEHIRSGVPIMAVTKAAGVQNLNGYSRWMYDHTGLPETKYRLWLRRRITPGMQEPLL